MFKNIWNRIWGNRFWSGEDTCVVLLYAYLKERNPADPDVQRALKQAWFYIDRKGLLPPETPED